MWAFINNSQPHIAKTPTVLQMEAAECGAASLSMLLAYYGCWEPLEKIREACGVGRDGVSAINIVKAAASYGCEAAGYRWSAETLKTKTYPLLIHWEFDHFVVLEGIKADRAYLNDPNVGHRTIPWADFLTSYTGIALQIRPGKNFHRQGHKYNIVSVLSKKLLKDKRALSFLLIICACFVIPGLATPVFSQIFLDDILPGRHPTWLPSLLLAMLGTIILESLLTWLRAWCLTKWQTKLTLADSSRFFWHVLQLPMHFFQQRFGGEVASRVAFAESTASVLTGSAATAIMDFFIALFYLLLLFQYNVLLTIIGLVFSLADVIVFFCVRQQLLELLMRTQQDMGKLNGVAMSGLLSIESLKANGNEADFFAKLMGFQTKIAAGEQQIALYNTLLQILPLLSAGVNTALIMTVGGFAIMEGLMTAGIFMAFQNLMGSFQTPFNNLLGLGSTLQTTETQLRRLDDVLCYPKDPLNYPEQKPQFLDTARLSGAVDLQDVVFGYSPLQKPLLENFQLHLEPGRWVALVGGSGSGKSTLAKIITGLYQEWSGQVLFDHIPRAQIPRAVICNSLAAVDQDIFLLSGTVEENITLFDKTIRHEDVLKAAQDACIHDDILCLNGGYEAQVTEGGVNFSGGQRQRLEIARALAITPSILIMDEATSAWTR